MPGSDRSRPRRDGLGPLATPPTQASDPAGAIGDRAYLETFTTIVSVAVSSLIVAEMFADCFADASKQLNAT